jgi:hypothetical protein
MGSLGGVSSSETAVYLGGAKNPTRSASTSSYGPHVWTGFAARFPRVALSRIFAGAQDDGVVVTGLIASTCAIVTRTTSGGPRQVYRCAAGFAATGASSAVGSASGSTCVTVSRRVTIDPKASVPPNDSCRISRTQCLRGDRPECSSCKQSGQCGNQLGPSERLVATAVTRLVSRRPACGQSHPPGMPR